MNATDELGATIKQSLSVPFSVAHGTEEYGMPNAIGWMELSILLSILHTMCKNEDGDRRIQIVEGGYYCLLSEDNKEDIHHSP